MIGGVEPGYWGYRAIYNQEHGYIPLLFITYTIISTIYIGYNLLESHRRYGIINTAQTRYVIIGCMLSLSTVIAVEILRMKNIFLAPLSDIFFLPLALCVAYAMLRYRFMRIAPELEKKAETKPRYNLKKGNTYIIKEEKSEKSLEVFIDSLTHGHRGLCITRTKPEKLKKKYNLHKTPIIWMTDIKSTEETINPTDIDSLYNLLTDFIEKYDGSIILIKRLGYLINRNGYDRILEFIQSLNDKITSSNCILLLSLNPLILDTKQLKMLEEETKDLFEFKEVRTLPEHLHNLLEYIYKQNLTRKPVAFKDISQKFSISKTTTGQRIHELEEKRLVEVRREGRYKMLMITEEGRKIFE
jgi:DNA-binding MarR family transcriptional regulator